MTDEQLTDLLENIYATKILEYAENDDCSAEEAAAAIAEGNIIHPPAKETQIARLEEDLGRHLPPSFKHFLRLANGWGGFIENRAEPGDCLIGTEFYADPDYLAQWKQWNGIFIYAPARLEVDESHPDFHPYHFYRILDGTLPCPPELIPARDFILNYSEARNASDREDDLMMARYLLLGWGPVQAILLDETTRRPDGEADIVVEDTGSLGGPHRYSNFYEFLRIFDRMD